MAAGEAEVEKHLVKQVERFGGMAEKFVSPGKKNVPDRICTWPGNFIDFVELKDEGEPPNGGQDRDHAKRRRLGVRVYVIDTKEKVDVYVKRARQRSLERISENGELEDL